MAHGDCETCVHYEDDGFCEDCVHYEHDYEDWYEEASPEQIAEMEEREYQKCLKEAITERIDITVSEEFSNLINIAKKCSSREHFRRVFMGVYADKEGYLVGSDTHRIVVIPCDYIPNELKGKTVIALEESQVAVNTLEYPNWRQVVEIGGDGYKNVQLESAVLESLPSERNIANLVSLRFTGTIYFFNGDFINTMREVLTGSIEVTYSTSENVKPVLFKGENGLMVIVPVRTEQAVI